MPTYRLSYGVPRLKGVACSDDAWSRVLVTAEQKVLEATDDDEAIRKGAMFLRTIPPVLYADVIYNAFPRELVKIVQTYA